MRPREADRDHKGIVEFAEFGLGQFADEIRQPRFFDARQAVAQDAAGMFTPTLILDSAIGLVSWGICIMSPYFCTAVVFVRNLSDMQDKPASILAISWVGNWMIL